MHADHSDKDRRFRQASGDCRDAFATMTQSSEMSDRFQYDDYIGGFLRCSLCHGRKPCLLSPTNPAVE